MAETNLHNQDDLANRRTTNKINQQTTYQTNQNQVENRVIDTNQLKVLTDNDNYNPTGPAMNDAEAMLLAQ